MSYIPIITYDYENVVELRGRTFPASCLIEDLDGMRILLIGSRTIGMESWIRAHTDGAQAILCVSPMSFTLASTFIEHRTENKRERQYDLEDEFWYPCDVLLTYMEMLSQVEHAPFPSMGGFVNLHNHSEASLLDGLSTVEEMVEVAVAAGQSALAMTDHGNCALHADLQLVASRRGIKPIFGMEAYFQEDRFARGGEHRYGYQHLVLWAMDEQGLRNLWAMSTEGFRDGLYDRKARIDWDTLTRLNAGVLASTACLRGPLLQPWENGDIDRAMANLGRLQDIFGDRLYIELHTNQLAKQCAANRWLVDVAREQKIPLIGVVDSHYPTREDRDAHRAWLSIQTNKDVQDEGSLFAGGQDYHMMSETEVREALAYLGPAVVEEAVSTTVRVANRCTATIAGKPHRPIYSRVTPGHADPVQHDVERLVDACLSRWEERTAGKPYTQEEAIARFEEESSLIIRKKFCGYFLMVQDQVMHAKNNGVLVGPGRGSGGGCFVGYLMGITEIDPVEHGLLFARFMTEGREELPDFDVDYPSNRKQWMLDYISQRWGADHVSGVGTHSRLGNKGAINDTARAMRSLLPDDIFMSLREVSLIIDEAESTTAGLGLSWEDLWAQAGDLLDPYRERFPDLFVMAERLVGRLRSFGRHAAAVVIDPDEPLTGALPLWGADEDGGGGMLVTQFDKDTLEALGYIKFDLLNVRNLDTIQEAVDLIRDKLGQAVDVYRWKEEYSDPEVWEQISDGWTLGMFQIETTAGTRLVRRFKPTSLAGLADVITLVRPGPKNSGLTDMYLRRRAGQEEVTYTDSRLEAILSKTYGAMLYQEDIMNVCMTLATYDSTEADKVRKILGKKKVELAVQEGKKFVARAVQNQTDQSTADHLWAQMEEFAKYSFCCAHAFAYAVVSYWTAWLKVHYPLYFLCATLSTAKAERIPDFVEEARRLGYGVRPPDINESERSFTVSSMAVRYGLLSISGIGDAAVQAILSARPYSSVPDFLERKGPKCDSGHVKTLARIGALDSLLPNRRGIEAYLEYKAITGSDTCVHKVDYEVSLTRVLDSKGTTNMTTLPCGFDWESEPIEIGRTGKPKKRRTLPKRCSRACRMFTPAPPPDPATIEPYTEADIRTIEMDLLGVYLSSTPFDRIPPEDRDAVSTAMDILTGPDGTYIAAAVLKAIRKTTDKHGQRMGFLTLTTERGELDCVVFHRTWALYATEFAVGALCYASIKKNSYGHSLEFFASLD